jgi:hypothetical protein
MLAAAGIVAFAKTVLLTQQQAIPPVVHFKRLHPLVTGLKAGADEATRMGHTYTEEVNVRGFPALFPMAASPLAGVSRTQSCPTGVSAFGFGGTMAHLIVDAQPLATLDRVRAPLRYVHTVSFPWQPTAEDNPAEKFQEYGELALGYLEGMVRACVEPHVHVEADLPRGGDVFAAGLSRDGAHTVRSRALTSPCLCCVARARCLLTRAGLPRQVCRELAERLGMDLPLEVLQSNPTISRLAEAVLQRGLVARAASGFSVAALVRSFMDLQATRQVVDPRRGRPPNAARNPGRMVFVLAGPRSGSTLTQLVLNMHPALYAGQELYLLQFYTMQERAQRLASRELSSWVFEGMRKTIMELRRCSLEDADALLEELADLPTQDVYSILQAWCGGRTLVDKTPPYIWSLDTLRRAETLFEEVSYIHVYRHPYANIASMAAEAINRDFIADAAGGAAAPDWAEKVRAGRWTHARVRLRLFPRLACCAHAARVPLPAHAQLDEALWSESEALWAQGNANVMQFFEELPPSRRMRLAYEDLLRAPEATSRALCTFLRLPYEPAMSAPYTAANMATFEPAAAGGLGAGDPKLRQNTGIDASMADAWHGTKVPRPLTPFAAHVAKSLGYALPPWKEPALRPEAPPELQRLNTATGGTPVIFMHGLAGALTHVRALATALPAPAIGVRMTLATRELPSMDALAAAYAQALRCLELPPRIFIAAADDFGARLGHALLQQLDAARGRGGAGETTPAVVSLVLLDSCLAGPLCTRMPPATRALWELALEGAALSGSPAPAEAAFQTSMDGCADEDEALELLAAAFKPDDMPLPEWDVAAMHLLQCVLRNVPKGGERRGGEGARALLLCSDTGAAERFDARSARLWAGELRTEHLAGLGNLLAADAAPTVAQALHKYMRAHTRKR